MVLGVDGFRHYAGSEGLWDEVGQGIERWRVCSCVWMYAVGGRCSPGLVGRPGLGDEQRVAIVVGLVGLVSERRWRDYSCVPLNRNSLFTGEGFFSLVFCVGAGWLGWILQEKLVIDMRQTAFSGVELLQPSRGRRYSSRILINCIV